MGRFLNAYGLFAVLSWGCGTGDGWRQTRFGDGAGELLADARCWVVRWEEVGKPGVQWVDTVFPTAAALTRAGMPGILQAGDAGSYRGPATSEWTAFSGDPESAAGEVNRRFEILHVCGGPAQDIDGALSQFGAQNRPWKRWGTACWCAPVPEPGPPWVEGEDVLLTTVAWHLSEASPPAQRTVTQAWNWGDEGQLMPVVLDFLSAHPRGGRLVCPCWEAFGPQGLPGAGWLPEGTVVLDLAVERPDSLADHEQARPLL